MRVGCLVKMMTTVRIFAGYDVDDDGSITFSERSVFPTSCVKKMELRFISKF